MLIREFLSRINADTEVDEQWENDLVAIIKDERLKDKETHIFIEYSFRDGVLKTTGTDVDAIMPAVSRFGGSLGNYTETRIYINYVIYVGKVMEENIKGKGKQIIQTALYIGSPVASVLLLINPAFLSIPIIASVYNESCAYFDAKSVEKGYYNFRNKLKSR